MIKPQWPATTDPYRVRFGETDLMGVVYHGNLFPFFELGRLELLRREGVIYKNYAEQGFNLAVVQGDFYYRQRIEYDDLLTTHTGVSDLKRSQVTFVYELARDGQVVASGHTRHCAVDAKGQPCPMPPELVKLLEKHLVTP